jgi:hypothetical protein
MRERVHYALADNFEQIVESVRSGFGMPDGLSPMEHLPSCLRGAFRAPLGFQFVAADLSQIELRVLAWLTQCVPMLETFANDLDLYIAFASAMYNVPSTTWSRSAAPDRQSPPFCPAATAPAAAS